VALKSRLSTHVLMLPIFYLDWAKMYRSADGVAQAIRLVTVKPCTVCVNTTLPKVMMLV
jgi:hypothetical protein